MDATPPGFLRWRGVSKSYPDGTVAVQSLDLDVREGELVCLVGPSGCGKTTTMKMVNRLVEPTSGTVELDGEDVAAGDVRDLRRRIGYVIQQVGLFPHQSVGENVATVPRLLGWDKARTRARVDELLDLVGLAPATYRDRYPAQLSGGQRQRIGVARALAADPPVLLMDEPFSAIDPIARDRLQSEFLAVQSAVRKTIVFVTHDVDEAVRLGDRIAVFRQGGVLEQFDTPAAVLGAPASPFVADFVGADRGLRRLAVTGIDRDDLESWCVLSPDQPVEQARPLLPTGVADRPRSGRAGAGSGRSGRPDRERDRGRRDDGRPGTTAARRDAQGRDEHHAATGRGLGPGRRAGVVAVPRRPHAVVRARRLASRHDRLRGLTGACTSAGDEVRRSGPCGPRGSLTIRSGGATAVGRGARLPTRQRRPSCRSSTADS